SVFAAAVHISLPIQKISKSTLTHSDIIQLLGAPCHSPRYDYPDYQWTQTEPNTHTLSPKENLLIPLHPYPLTSPRNKTQCHD
ncbi:hypothetical protein AAA524_32750, partial [Pseudomonas aeruginosa]